MAQLIGPIFKDQESKIPNCLKKQSGNTNATDKTTSVKVKLPKHFIMPHLMKIHARMYLYFHTFLTLALGAAMWSDVKSPSTHWVKAGYASYTVSRHGKRENSLLLPYIISHFLDSPHTPSLYAEIIYHLLKQTSELYSLSNNCGLRCNVLTRVLLACYATQSGINLLVFHTVDTFIL